MDREIEISKKADQQMADLKQELAAVRGELIDSEAALAEYQAEVNAFRMHCRLKLDAWIERLLNLQTQRQKLRIRLELLRQGAIGRSGAIEDDPFWKEEEPAVDEPTADGEELLLPTDTPRDKAAEQRLYRELARKYHPDLAATAVEVAYRTEMMAAVNSAYAGGDVQTLYDLADQLDPQHRAELAAIEQKEIRELRGEIIRLRQQKRRAARRLSTLREENTARLWQKAQLLEVEDVHWWEIVRQEIEKAIQRLEADIADIEEAIEAAEPLTMPDESLSPKV